MIRGDEDVTELSAKSTLVTQILTASLALPLSLYVTWAYFFRPSAFIEAAPNAQNALQPVWGVALTWLICALMLFLTFRFKRVLLINGRVVMRGWFNSYAVLPRNVYSVEWVREPYSDYAPIAKITFEGEGSLPREVLFVPRSPSHFQAIRSFCSDATAA